MKNFLATVAIFGSAVLPMAATAESIPERCDHFENILMDMERADGVHVANLAQDGEEKEIYFVQGRYFILDWNDEEICSNLAPKWVVDQIKR